MPLDKNLARRLVEGAESAYARSPHSEFIGKLAASLRAALEEVDTAQTTALRAQNEVSRYQREIDEEKTAYRKLREQSVHTEAMIAVLREIAKSPKGAQKKAEEMLKTVVGEEKVVPMVPAKVVVP